MGLKAHSAGPTAEEQNLKDKSALSEIRKAIESFTETSSRGTGETVTRHKNKTSQESLPSWTGTGGACGRTGLYERG